MKVINYGLKVFEGAAEGGVLYFNEILASEGPNTFVVNLQNLLGSEEEMRFNLTMSKAPEFSSAMNEILLHIDSDFVSDDMQTYVPENDIWVNYTDVTQKEQLWIHQSLINTALYDLEKRLSGEGFQKNIFLLLPELHDFYGADASCDGVLTFPKESNSQLISIDKE